VGKVQVQTACRDCQMCTGHKFTGAGRSIGRGTADVMSLGITNVARRTCKACDHPMSEHRGEVLNINQQQAQSPAEPPPAQWVRQPDGRFRWWNGGCWTDHVVNNPNDRAEVDATGAVIWQNPPRWIQQPDGRFRWWAGLQWTEDYTRDPSGEIEYLPRQAQSQPTSSAAELERLATMYDAGHLTAQEFAAAKARLLGL
jgi:hypothetical protein